MSAKTKPIKPTKREVELIEDLVHHFEASISMFDRLASNLVTLLKDNKELPPLIHSVKSRVKDPSHLRDKLSRKLLKCREAGKPFDINIGNIFEKINDLVGVRILHLHTTQIQEIDKGIKSLLDHEKYEIIEGPFARTWDDEYREYFKSIGFATEQSASLYTSVHYVVLPSRKTKYTAEIQVRTLAEELWGEVAHLVDYPHPTGSVACQEQIKVLARVTSSCTRLVDSIFESREEHKSLEASAKLAGSAKTGLPIKAATAPRIAKKKGAAALYRAKKKVKK